MDDIRSKLQAITTQNGYMFPLSDVKCGASVSELRPRGVAINQDNGSVVIECNATGKTLEMMRQYIAELLEDEFTIDSDGIESPLRLTPKQTNQEDEDDATS